jgi:hypothetical protein
MSSPYLGGSASSMSSSFTALMAQTTTRLRQHPEQIVDTCAAQ